MAPAPLHLTAFWGTGRFRPPRWLNLTGPGEWSHRLPSFPERDVLPSRA